MKITKAAIILSELELWMNESFITYACDTETGNRLEVNSRGDFRITVRSGQPDQAQFMIADSTTACRVYNALEGVK